MDLRRTCCSGVCGTGYPVPGSGFVGVENTVSLVTSILALAIGVAGGARKLLIAKDDRDNPSARPPIVPNVPSPADTPVSETTP
jgi:hypothetical protein